MMIADLCPNPDIGQELKEMDYTYINTLAVLKFNIDDNMIVDRITEWQKPTEEEDHELDNSYVERLMKKISGEKKPRYEEP
jgi:hypothetical protein